MKTSHSKEPKANYNCYSGILIETVEPPNFQEINKIVKREVKKLIWPKTKIK